VHAAVGFDRISLLLATTDGAHLELVATFGNEGSPPPMSLPLSSAAGPIFQAVESRRPVAVLDDSDLRAVLPLDAAYTRHPYFRTTRFVIAPSWSVSGCSGGRGGQQA
jgi:hypothetical protein